MKKFITSDVLGGIGNQMFMIAHAVTQSWKHDVSTKFLFQKSGYSCRDSINYKNTMYRNINFADSIPTVREMTEDWGIPIHLKDVSESIKFNGYFQSIYNWNGYDKEIQKLFEPTELFRAKMEAKYPQIKSNNTLSIHVRRGDYLKISSYLPPVSTSYIDEAIQQNGEYDTLFAFSDDIQWIRGNIKHPNMIIVDGLDAAEAIWLMSMCTNNIICNSTFSWWGAFLNKNENKKVFIPSLWYGIKGTHPMYPPYSSVYDTGWTKVNVRYENGKLVSR